MNPSNFVILYMNKFGKNNYKPILNRFEEASFICSIAVDYLSYDLVKHILPDNCLVVEHDFFLYSGSLKDHLLRNKDVRSFIKENKHVLFFEINQHKIIVKGKSWYHIFDPRKVVLVNVLDKEYVIRRLNKLIDLRPFS